MGISGLSGQSWEYLSAGRQQNFTALLAEFRQQLDELNPGLLLTVATPAGEARTKINLDEIHPYLDFINVMTYDFHGTWDTQTGFQANLYVPRQNHDIAVDTVIQYYLGQGVPSGKLVVGVPFYSRGWTGVTDQNHGLFQPAAGPAAGTWEAGAEDYKVLSALWLPARPIAIGIGAGRPGAP